MALNLSRNNSEQNYTCYTNDDSVLDESFETEQQNCENLMYENKALLEGLENFSTKDLTSLIKTYSSALEAQQSQRSKPSIEGTENS